MSTVLTSLIDAEHQYIEGPDPELYDLVADPSQTRNVLRERRRIPKDQEPDFHAKPSTRPESMAPALWRR